MTLKSAYEYTAAAYFLLATAALMILAFAIMGSAVLDVVRQLQTTGTVSIVALQSVGLLIIGFAIVETSTFIAEEEIFKKRELRSSSESRRSLTKFVTIIVIASSLEALVMIFSASRTDVSNAIYAAAILFVAMFALAALGVYQWLSSRIFAGDKGVERKQPDSKSTE